MGWKKLIGLNELIELIEEMLCDAQECRSRTRGKAPEDWRSPRCFALCLGVEARGSVLDCASPLAVFHIPRCNRKYIRNSRTWTPGLLTRLWERLWPARRDRLV